MAVPWIAIGPASEQLLAQAEPRNNPVPQIDPWALWWHYLALLAFALLGILALYLITRWRKRAAADRLSASEQLSEFRDLYDKGQLSREEFERLRTLLGDRMKREMEGQPPPPAGAPPPRRAAEEPPIQLDEPESGIRPAEAGPDRA
jgi:hypothetical protein